MDYEKAYKGAIERAKAEQETFIKEGNISGKSAIERIFPELYVNEDERIKNEIIAFVEQSIHRGGGTPIPQEQENKWIAWLEKQGEQKPTDKVESKFKVGDWITNGGLLVGQVISFDGEYYHYMCEGIEQPLHISNVYNWHLWTTQDAKDGDVLSDEKPFIFRGFGDSEHPDNPTAYCGINSSGTFILSTENEWWTADDFYPATKEQCDLLFQKMKEAGYEWDAEKKELKNIEQKQYWSEKQGEQNHTDKVEPKFKLSDWVVDKHYLKTYQVFSIDNSEHNYIVYSCKPLFNTDRDWPCFYEDTIRLWTVQDAKDGDILEFGDHGRLVIGIVSYVNRITGKVDVNCLLENNNFKVGNYYNLDTIKPHPATEEQCDLLFQKMKEAGYEWDDEKKELKKIKPKFKVGDCVVYNRNDSSREILYVYDIRDGRYYFNDNIHFSWSIKECDEKSHLWTIQDAKDGDALAFDNDTIVIFKDLYNATSFHSYCHIEDGVFNISKEEISDWWDGEGFKPATKEQCDLLFSKMKEAGYEWDAEKKELKNIEQTSTWSEEDEERIEFLIAMCDDEQAECVNNSTIYRECTETKDWLKSLKNRVQPQLKQEWNEKDDKILNAVIKDIQERHPEAIWKINSGNTVAVSTEYIIDWLKSFKPNYWKPSEQNIKDLEWCADLVKDKMGVGFHRLQVFIDELKSL